MEMITKTVKPYLHSTSSSKQKKKEMTYSISRTVSKRGGRKEELNVCYVLVLQTNTKDQMRTIRRNACLVYSLGLRVHSDTAELRGYPKQKMCYC